ncbi:T9SS type A sorting domain-containing protein [Flavobacteriaceae bacterium F08102]|nr:T9SS type A sorting domain-containing protein [Flavobacteriaceae bacterium F08102]
MKHIAKYILITVCFITTPLSSQILIEGFENASSNWIQYQLEGNNGFNRTNSQSNSGSYSAHTYTNNASFFGSTSNEVWLVSPKLDLSSSEGTQLNYYECNVNASGGAIANNPDQEVLFSTDYIGSGNPNTATWTVLNSTNATTSWNQVSITDQLPVSSNVYIAFKYVGSSYNFFFTATDRAWHIDDIELLTYPCAYQTVWKNNQWTNGAPTANTTAIIKSNYDTATDGSFESCSLIIRKNATVNIRANEFITVHNDLKVVGTLEVRHEGSLVMTDDYAVINGKGITHIHKTSNPLNLYDYNYWTSPVQNEVIGDAFPSSPIDNIYYYNTTHHNGNNNSGWQNVQSNTKMVPAMGYIALAPTSGTFPQRQSVTFSGKVNNGIITTAIGVNDTEIDWNLIGNPYPSSISIDSLFSNPVNSNLDKTIYVWTHNTHWNGNSSETAYTTDDYASYTPIMGGTAAKSGGNKARGYISSGQSFFINANAPGTITFKNSMRSKAYNNQFYKAQESHKSTQKSTHDISRIWLNMSNQEGAFSQLLIGFTDIATDGKDAYDGPSLGTGYISFYSIIEGKGYVVNGMSKLKDEKIIPLGFTSYVAKGTPLKIEIDELDGVLTTDEYDVYLIDKDQHTTLDLKLAPYTFTAGESAVYNDRFELQLRTKKTLEVDDEHIHKNIIIQSHAEELNISINTHDQIKTIKVYDIQGRLLFNKTNQKETHTLNTQGVAKGTLLIIQVWTTDNISYSKKTIL